jgi:hypothetical protein
MKRLPGHIYRSRKNIHQVWRVLLYLEHQKSWTVGLRDWYEDGRKFMLDLIMDENQCRKKSR